MRMIGLRQESESWNTMLMSRPRISASLRGERRRRSTPRNLTAPPATRVPRGSSRAIAETVSVLPEPDSPTRPKGFAGL